MRRGTVYFRDRVAGELKEDAGYTLTYDRDYLRDPDAPAISARLPKREAPYHSPYLFPFFANMLSEGSNRAVQAMLHHVDKDDDFGILLATAYIDTPGAVSVERIENE